MAHMLAGKTEPDAGLNEVIADRNLAAVSVAAAGGVEVFEFVRIGLNQDGHVVIEFKRTFLVYKRGQVPRMMRPLPKEATTT